jgi:hypothetical protein
MLDKHPFIANTILLVGLVTAFTTLDYFLSNENLSSIVLKNTINILIGAVLGTLLFKFIKYRKSKRPKLQIIVPIHELQIIDALKDKYKNVELSFENSTNSTTCIKAKLIQVNGDNIVYEITNKKAIKKVEELLKSRS